MRGSHYIGGTWRPGGGPAFRSANPADGSINWSGREAEASEVDEAVAAARAAFEAWADAAAEERQERVQAYARELKGRAAWMAEIISRETGKPLWEAAQEVDAMLAKVPASIDAYRERCRPGMGDIGGVTAAKRFKPHGVTAVLGPFNLPGHLPHSHIVPALLAGNTVVWKPSEQTPLVGEAVMEIWEKATLPPGVFNMIQGGRRAGEMLAAHPGLDGLYFTGSYAAGLALNRLFADHPERILALEMGGNNALIAWDFGDTEAAVSMTLQSAYITAGQRCVCARRLIIRQGREGEAFLDALIRGAERMRVGVPSERPEPYMGTLISPQAAARMLEAQESLRRLGGEPLLSMRAHPSSEALLTPGIIDVTQAGERPDEEHFGPLLQVVRAPDFDAALREAGSTRFGLAAGILTDKAELHERFFRRSRAGVINWNRPLTGASARLPFGGVGASGNHRPSAYHAADYCAYPVASLEARTLKKPAAAPPGLEG